MYLCVDDAHKMRWNVLLSPVIATMLAHRAMAVRMFQIRMEYKKKTDCSFFSCGESPQRGNDYCLPVAHNVRILQVKCIYWITQQRENSNVYQVLCMWECGIQVIQSIIFPNMNPGHSFDENSLRFILIGNVIETSQNNGQFRNEIGYLYLHWILNIKLVWSWWYYSIACNSIIQIDERL